MPFLLSHSKPAIAEYNDLRSSVGWPTFKGALVEEALANTLFSVCVRDNENLIGMGRIIGDNAIYLHIQDLIVRPDAQKKGVGRLIMDALLMYVAQAGGSHTNIGLMCSKGQEKFYQEFGFIERPNEKYGAGMIQVKE